MKSSVKDVIEAIEATVSTQQEVIVSIVDSIVSSISSGGKLLLCGNGGSAADCQHIAAEFVNRFKMERVPLAAVALTTDTSILTAVANDYSFLQVFSKQVQALGKAGDVLIGISTSGSSPNVIEAIKVGKDLGLVTVGFTGAKGSEMTQLCDMVLMAQSLDTPRIQEVHIFCAHVICEMVERRLFE